MMVDVATVVATEGFGNLRPTDYALSKSLKGEPLEGLQEWAQQDSNLRPTDYESAALTN